MAMPTYREHADWKGLTSGMVPLFIANGDIIRVDTAGKKYLGKETAGE